MANQSSPVAFGSTSFRFDVRGTHPRGRPLGTVIASSYYTSEHSRRLGPGTHDVPLDLTLSDAKKRMASTPLDEWTMTSNNPKRDHLVTSHQKTLRETRAEEASSLGPGFYDTKSFADALRGTPSSLTHTAQRPLSQPGFLSKSPASRAASPSKPASSQLPVRARSVSPPYGFGRLTTRVDQRELHKTSTFAGDMFQATNNITAPGLYDPAPPRSPHSKTYHSSFNSSTPRFGGPHLSVEYESERLRPRNTTSHT